MSGLRFVRGTLLLLLCLILLRVPRNPAAAGPVAGLSSGMVEGLVQAMQPARGPRFTVEVKNTSRVFSRVSGTHIEISRALVDEVFAKSGRAGLAFLLGHEIAHSRVGPGVTGAAVEFEADRIGFKLARKAVPGLDGVTVRRVFNAFDSAGTGGGLLASTAERAGAAASSSHPTNAARLQRLARSYGYSRALGFDKVANTTGFQASPRGVGGRAVRSIRADLVHGGLAVDVAVAAGLSIYNRVHSGGSFKQGLRDAGDYLTSGTFWAGDLLGGVLGAALGSMIPLPGGLVAAGMMGQALACLPALAGAMAGARIGVTAVSLLKDGRFSFSNFIHGMDVIGLAVQSVGASLGMTLGSLLPVPVIGSMLGALTGALVAQKILDLFRGGGAVKAAAARTDGGRPSDPLKASVTSGGLDTALTDKKADRVELERSRDRAYREFVESVRNGVSESTGEKLLRYRKLQSLVEGR